MAESFEQLARRAMELAVPYRDGERTPAPRPQASLEELRARFDKSLPRQGRSGVALLEELAAAAEQGLVGNIRPNFFSWVMGASHPVGVAAEWLATTWGQNAGIYATAPAAAVAEEVVARWLLELLQLPTDSSVGFTTGATMASTICLAAARSEVLRRVDYDLERRGSFGAPAVRVFLGAEAHSTIFTGLHLLGFGDDNITRVAVDEQGRMRAAALAQALQQQPGPGIVICQAGHINSGAFDPLADIIPLCRKHGAWCHVDGAFGLWARVVPDLQSLCSAAEQADSWSVDGHKWLQVPYESGFAIVRDRIAHLRTMDTSASYLEEAPGDARDPSRFCPELSRRARGFAVWAVMQALGRDGIAEMVARHCQCAQQLAGLLSTVPGITVLNEVTLNQLAVSFGDGAGQDPLTDAVLAELARENTVFVEGANWRGQRILRVSIISRETNHHDIQRLAASIQRAWNTVRSNEGLPNAGT